MDNLETINALAERSPGFVWRFKDESGNATGVKLFDDPNVIVNASVWESAAALESFVFRTIHRKFLARRDWFDTGFGPPLALWWIEPGTIPDIFHALARWRMLRKNGPTKLAFGWEGATGAELWKTAR
jgi:hypothetical protein